MAVLPEPDPGDLALVDQSFLDYCRGWKDKVVAKADLTKPHSDDITPIFTLTDEGREPLAIVLVNGGRDEALSGLMALVPGMSAAEAILCTDSHYTTTMVNPANGREWNSEDNRMDAACENGACALGIITDCLAICGVRRDGVVWNVVLPYHVHAEDKTVHWQAMEGPMVDRGKDSHHVEGVVVDAMRDFMATPSLAEIMVREGIDPGRDFGITDPRRIHLHQCIAVMKMLAGDDRFLIALTARNPEEFEVIQESVEQERREREAATMIATIDALTQADTKKSGKTRPSGLLLP